jgi:hypothetical protein
MATAIVPEIRLNLFDPQTGAPTLNNPLRSARPEPVMPIALVAEVFAVLEKYGHHRPEGHARDAATGRSIGALVTLVDAYTGVRS